MFGVGSKPTTDGDNNNDERVAEDNDDNDEDFDLQEFEKTKCARNREDDDNQDIDDMGNESDGSSSQATLQDMSSVELNLGGDELDALSVVSDNTSENEQMFSSTIEPLPKSRKSRASRSSLANTSGEDSTSNNKPDIGTVDQSNIVHGKRRRHHVDYQR